MPILTYEFLPDIFRDQDTRKLAVIYRPYVFVKLGRNKKWSKNFIKALVDSGSDNNIFPATLAREIGIDYKTGKQRKIVGIGNQEVDAYMHMARIKIEAKEFETIIQFGETVQTPLLGREGFFNYFDRVTINVKKRFLELKY